MGARTDNVIRLQKHPDGVGAAIRSVLDMGRFEIVSNGPNAEVGFIGSDPYNTNAFTGLVVPATPSAALGGARYLFMLARASFGNGEQNAQNQGVRLVGIRQYAELVARLPVTNPATPPLAAGPPIGSTITLRKEIESPLWHPPDGNISWHVMVVPRGYRDTRNPANADGFIFQDSPSPSLLYQVAAPYAPPNGGRPWGTPLGSSLGNIHELRYRWRSDLSENVLDIPIPTPCDVALFASVRQNDPTTNPVFATGGATDRQFEALSPEDKFLIAYPTLAQYGTIAGALVFNQDVGADVP